MWYYARAGQQLGPVSEDELRGMLRRGDLAAGDLVWREGMAAWVAAGQALGEVATTAPVGIPAGAPASPWGAAPQAAGMPAGAVPQPTLGYAPSAAWEAQQGVQYAGFWIRFLAAFIDGIITSVVGGLVGYLIGEGWAVDIFNLVFGWLFEALFLVKYGATPGKMALGIRVVQAADYGPIGFGRATGRYFAKILSALILLIGFIMAAFTQRKQSLHDIIAGTVVIKVRR